MITFVTSIDPDQARHIVGPVLDHSDGIPERFFFEKVNFEKKSKDNKNMNKISALTSVLYPASLCVLKVDSKRKGTRLSLPFYFHHFHSAVCRGRHLLSSAR